MTRILIDVPVEEAALAALREISGVDAYASPPFPKALANSLVTSSRTWTFSSAPILPPTSAR